MIIFFVHKVRVVVQTFVLNAGFPLAIHTVLSNEMPLLGRDGLRHAACDVNF